VSLVAVYHLLPKYDFLLPDDQSQIWGVFRCNRITGRVTLASLVSVPLEGKTHNYKVVALIQEGNWITHRLVLDIPEKYGSIENK
jgi:hypothetical protein